jgi:DNA-binding beta-propeller fold protein YncE
MITVDASPELQWTRRKALIVALVILFLGVAQALRSSSTPRPSLSGDFVRQVLAPVLPEAPLELRLFTTAVKTDSRGRIITGLNSDPVKNIVGAEAAGPRAGLDRFTKIMFAADYFTGRPDPGQRIDPNRPSVSGGSKHWPFVKQPFRGWPNSLALTPDGRKLYVSLPGREGYPDWRIAAVDPVSRKVLRWIDLRAAGNARGTRPLGLQVAPVNTVIYPNPYLVVLNQYANFATVIDTATDAVIGEFQTGFYGEKLVFNRAGTRLYMTDRFKDQVRVFDITRGPFFTQIAEIPTGANDLERANPRDLVLSDDETQLYAANTLGHTVAVIDTAALALKTNIIVGGLATDVDIAGPWGIISGHSSTNTLNGPETGNGMPKRVGSGFIRNNGDPLGYLPVMSDTTRATTFDDLGSELKVFSTATNKLVYRYVDFERNQSMLAVPGQIVDLGDWSSSQTIIRGSGPEQIFVRGNFLFVTQMHSDKVEVFRINRTAADPSGVLTHAGIEFTGGITPEGIAVSNDGRTVYVANRQTEDVSLLSVDANGRLQRAGLITVGVTGSTPDPAKGGNGAGLFATGEEQGLRWLFSASYSDDGQKSCGHCHWQSRHDGSQWNVGANAIGGPKVCPQNKDISDNWPEWFEGLSNAMPSYASSCNGELVVAERRTALFPQADLEDRLSARDEFVLRKTEENSKAIGRGDLSGKAAKVGFYDMAFLQILWTQNETHRMPNPLTQFPSPDEAAKIARGRDIFSREVSSGGAGCASCHRNGNQIVDGVPNNTLQDYNIHEPGVVAETTVGGDGPFMRLTNDYFFEKLGPPQDLGSRQNISSRNTKHLRSFWDSVPRWLHHGSAHSLRELLLPPDSPVLRSGERGFNFRTVRSDHQRRVAHDFLGGPPISLPTEVPITLANSGGGFAGDAKGPVYVSLDPPAQVSPPDAAYPEGRLVVDRLGSDNLAPLTANGQINPALATSGIRVIKDTHGKTSHLPASDIEALSLYLLSLQ